jgi:hypothetical protein
MSDALIEKLRPLGVEQYATRLARIVGNATQVVVGGGQIQKGLVRDEAGLSLISDMDDAAGRLSDDGAFVLDIVGKIGEANADALMARANLEDQSALELFRDKARKDGGVVKLLQRDLGGIDQKLTVIRTGFKDEFAKLPATTGTAVVTSGLPAGPMMTMSNSMGCTGAKFAIGGGMGMMAVGMVMEDGGMFTMGAAALGIGIGAAAYFC